MKPVQIICPVYNGLTYLKKMIPSLLKYTTSTPYELIIVDNASGEETQEYLKSISSSFDSITVISNKENKGFAGGVNTGFRHIKNKEWDYVAVINSDLIFSTDWLEHLLEGFKLPNKHVGIIGATSNAAGGWQGRTMPCETVDEFHDSAEKVYNVISRDPNRFINVTNVVGLCIAISRPCFDAVGEFDERFFPGNHEDNDYCLRAVNDGYVCLVDQAVYVFHYFNKSFEGNKFDSRKIFLETRKQFHNKWSDIEKNKKQKLVGFCRVKDGAAFMENTLTRVSDFCDEIVILIDQATTDDTEKICQQFLKVVDIEREEPHPYDEAWSRNYVFEMAKKRNPTWFFSFDADELPSAKLVFKKDWLMNPYNPHIQCWTFPVIQLWNSDTYYRKDGLWGKFSQGRMFKNLPNQRIGGNSDDLIHSGSTPHFAAGATAHAELPILHYGNIDKNYRFKKYEWYTKTDTNKNLDMVLGAFKEYYWVQYYGEPTKLEKDNFQGQWGVIKDRTSNVRPPFGMFYDEDCYRHVIDETGLVLEEFKEFTGITLCMIAKNEEIYIKQAISSLKSIVDEVIVVDTGSTDRTVEICKELGANVIEMDWDVMDPKKGFSHPRNVSIKAARTPWIIRIDPDEYVPQEFLKDILSFTEHPVDGYIFPIRNFLEDPLKIKDPKWVLSETCRMFRNHPELEYTMCVHEELDDAWKKLARTRVDAGQEGVVIKKVAQHIFHFGYLRGKEFLDNKFAKYCALGESQIEKNPTDARAYFNVAVHYYHVGQYDKALQGYLKCLELDPAHWMACNDLATLLYGQGNYLKAKEYFELAYKNIREHDNPINVRKVLDNMSLINIKVLENMVF